MRKRASVHYSGTAVRRPPDRGEVEKIVAVAAVKTGHFMAKAGQVSRYVSTHITAMPGDKNPHGP